MGYERINAYHIMWIFVYFDLPTNTKQERRNAALFRKNLEKDGFTMMQYSVYVRHCASKEHRDIHMAHVRRFLPPDGYVCMHCITDRQYSEIENYWKCSLIPNAQTPLPIEFY